MSQIEKLSVKLALEAATAFESQETGFLHLSYEGRPFVKGDPIAIYHNFLFAYALLKNKERSTMERGFDLIDRLLNFQIDKGEESGGFPRYLHEYPYVQRSFEIIDMLLVLFWIFKDFQTVLPKKIHHKINEALTKGLNRVVALVEQKEHSYLLRLQEACLLKAVGGLLELSAIELQGEKMLEKVIAQGPNKSWGSTRHLAKMILFLQIVEDEHTQIAFDVFWDFLVKSWSVELKSYIGAGLNEHVFEDHQEPTLYHDYMCGWLSQEKAPLLDADRLEALLLKTPCREAPIQAKKSFSYSLAPFEIFTENQELFSYSYFNLDRESWEKRGGFYPLKLLLQNQKGRADSLVLQMGSFTIIQQLTPTTLLLTFSHPQDVDIDVAFYTNLSSGASILSSGNKASMFNLADSIEIHYHKVRVIMTFPETNSQRGMWAQQVRENRKSQMVKDFNKTFDRHLYFRKTDPKDEGSLQMQIEILPI